MRVLQKGCKKIFKLAYFGAKKNVSNACLVFSQCTFSKTLHISIYVIRVEVIYNEFTATECWG